jgi:hypothetical protein
MRQQTTAISRAIELVGDNRPERMSSTIHVVWRLSKPWPSRTD